VRRHGGRRQAVRGGIAVLLFLVVAVSLAVAARPAPATALQRAERLDAELRCPVCQGLSVADSPSSTARAIAADVARRVASGQSDEQVRRAYVSRYGPGILLAPDGVPGVVALALPVVLATAGAVGLVLALRRSRGRPRRKVDPRDEELVARLRAAAGSTERAPR